MRRGDNIGKLERELDALRGTIAETEAEQARQAGFADQAIAEKRHVAGDVAAFSKADGAASAHRLSAERLGYLLAGQAENLLELEKKLEQARYDSAFATLEQATDRQHSASDSLAKALVAAIDALPALEAARDEVAAALARARQLLPSDADFEHPSNFDEIPFPDGVDRLLELVQTRLANEAALRARYPDHGDSDSVVEQAVREALRDRDYERIGRLTPWQLRKVIPVAEKLAQSLPLNERDAEIVAKRLERVRELVASETSAV